MDRISDLSDELLLKILLLVPTKVAVSTSILSKRREYLWMWLPKLDYDSINCSEPEYKRLQCFLDKNMPLHRAPVIESFCLGLCESHFKPENINMWVVIALSHFLRELEILYESYQPIILPSNLYTCKSLVILKLDGRFLLDVPRMVSLPSLKTLKLQSVSYFSDETLQRLLSNCPVLEDLEVDLHSRGTTRELSIGVPSLQSLSLDIPSNYRLDGFVIETPALKCFKLFDYKDESHYCLVENMPSLVEAYVDVDCPDINSIIGPITSVKRLFICSKTMFDEGYVFNQLEHLEVCHAQCFSGINLSGCSKLLLTLKRLDVSLMHGHDHHQGMDDMNEPSTVPECMLSSLQSLSWSFYTGTPQ